MTTATVSSTAPTPVNARWRKYSRRSCRSSVAHLFLERLVGPVLVERVGERLVGRRIERILPQPLGVIVEQQRADDDGNHRRHGRDPRGKLIAGVVVRRLRSSSSSDQFTAFSSCRHGGLPAHAAVVPTAVNATFR